ncbi:hypothetical protein P8825_15215 [Shouchella clausii]|uniref:hypothetical protein n=1 Tax=Shouchella clausii TaxID=79880 RepID=UPI002DB867D5|nr:hypothetical protein [Shouchella clausii]MEB5480914.1 hypothetical protein [Shouchella clausii]
MLDRDALKESLTLDDIKKIMAELGSASPKEGKDGQVIFQTVCHGGNSHKLYYYEHDRTFKCYTDCGIKGNIFDIVIAAKESQGFEMTFVESLKYVAKFGGKESLKTSSKYTKNNLSNDMAWLSKFNKKPINTKLKVYDEKILRTFLPYPHESWIEEGISYNTQKLFEIGYYMREDKITIPQRDINGQLVGIRGRAMRSEDLENGRKYMPLIINNVEYTVLTGMYLYGLNITAPAIKKYKRAIIYEAEKSVQKDFTIYGEESCATAVGGGNVSKWHVQQLVDLGVEEVVLAFDRERTDILETDDEKTIKKKEKANFQNQKKLRMAAEKFAPYCRAYVLYDVKGLIELKEAPIDRGREVLEELMKDKILIESRSAGD